MEKTMLNRLIYILALSTLTSFGCYAEEVIPENADSSSEKGTELVKLMDDTTSDDHSDEELQEDDSSDGDLFACGGCKKKSKDNKLAFQDDSSDESSDGDLFACGSKKKKKESQLTFQDEGDDSNNEGELACQSDEDGDSELFAFQEEDEEGSLV
jgi:hypothetical protein